MEYDEDSEGLIVAIRTSQGNSQSVVYDALEQVKSMTDVFGNVTSYSYDLHHPGQEYNSTWCVGCNSH
ncbi:RHS repeat protein [Microcoleus sp. A003_D6]|uniref:RHS repeat domain-containing protein n=1 Tax=Microcoleus sp. A003_D6 TaxID=3055266 RepID=UPI002FD4F06C